MKESQFQLDTSELLPMIEQVHFVVVMIILQHVHMYVVN